MEEIIERWRNAAKIKGCKNVLTLANGDQVMGCYYLVESGSYTPSHNALEGFSPSAGFPSVNGQNVNDRDYYRDSDAQQVTRGIARDYDARAIQNPVVVSPDGVVLSGNGRTMAGELAAHDGTDTAYIAHLRNYCTLYGFNAGDVYKFQHPRLVFVLDESLPYTATTFAMFNAQDMKTQSKTEQAVKFGKLVDDRTFGRIITTINGFETLGDFYACVEAVTRCINDLRSVGAIDGMSYAQMFDGDTISSTGKETMENVLIGKAFAINPDAARQITTFKSLRKSVVYALAEVANNLTLSDEYTLNNDLTNAIQLAYTARKSGYKSGERVSIFARQTALFGGNTSYNEVAMLMADLLNDEQVTKLKKYLTIYNQNAQASSNGQTDMFTGGIRTKREILEDVKAIFATGAAKEQLRQATEQRKGKNTFLSDEQLTTLAAGGYCNYTLPSGETIVCQIHNIDNTIIYLIAKGGIKLWTCEDYCTPTADHNPTLPTWLQAGTLITDGELVQRITSVRGKTVNLEWVNGGYFDIDIPTALQGWRAA